MTNSFQIERLKRALLEADAVLIGAGAGLSTSAGFVYGGKRFEKNFADFEAKYGFHDMYSGGFYPYESYEEFWAYWSRYIVLNRYSNPPKPVYDDLFSLVKDKNYFVLTTNVDHCFQKAGFDKARLFYTQGDFGLFQCSVPCSQQTYDNKAIVFEMCAQEKNMRIPSELIPHCPKCGAPMTMNLRSDDLFAEDDGWHAACARYEKFLNKYAGGNTLFLELGVGSNTPGIIKYPFIRMALQNKQAVYACLNLGEAYCPSALGERGICIDRDIGEVLKILREAQ